jgi:hypothetical protein
MVSQDERLEDVNKCLHPQDHRATDSRGNSDNVVCDREAIPKDFFQSFGCQVMFVHFVLCEAARIRELGGETQKEPALWPLSSE